MSLVNKEYKRGPTAYNLYYSSAIKELKESGLKLPSKIPSFIADKWSKLPSDEKDKYQTLSKKIKDKITSTSQEKESKKAKLAEKNSRLGEYYRNYSHFLLQLVEKGRLSNTSIVLTGYYLNKISDIPDTVGNEMAYLLACFALSLKMLEDNSVKGIYTILSKGRYCGEIGLITKERLVECETKILKHLEFDLLPKDSPIWGVDELINELNLSQNKKRIFRYWVYKICSILYYNIPIKKQTVYLASMLMARKERVNKESLLFKLVN